MKHDITIIPKIMTHTAKSLLRPKCLAVFDFDHTIADKNTDTEVINLIPQNSIPLDIKNLYLASGWTCYMREIFKLLHSNKCEKELYLSTICNIPEVNGMTILLKKLKEQLNYNVIIISDSNSIFIDYWLHHNNLQDYIDHIFTNPAKFNESGLLEIEPFHHQTACTLSTENLCKGQVLEEYLKCQSKLGNKYSKVIYVGDGSNDLCPMLRLTDKDAAFPRIGYQCIKKIGNNDTELIIKAKIHPWTDANDILKLEL